MKNRQASSLQCACILAVFAAQSACQSSLTGAQTESHGTEHPDKQFGENSSVVELERLRWQIGDLDAETLFVLEDGIPHQYTTITNNNATDRWWTGLKIYGYSASGWIPPINTDPISDEEWERLTEEELSLRSGSGWGGGGGQACKSSSALPEIKRGTVRMRPGESRSYHDSHPNYPASPKRETVTRWSLKGRACFPSNQPFEEWPPFQIDLKLRWDKEDGCSIEAEPIGGVVRGNVFLEGAVPEPVRAPLDEGMQELLDQREFISRRWLVGEESGLANCVISLSPLNGLEQPPLEAVDDAVFEKIGPYYHPQVLVVTAGTEVTLRTRESSCGGFHAITRKNQAFNRIIPAGEEHTWLAEREEIVPVMCDIQPHAHGVIVILDTPHYAKTDAEGHFSIRDLAPGTYILRAFHEGLGVWVKDQVVEIESWGHYAKVELRTAAKIKESGRR
jgi:hypothetical protein